MDWTDLAQMTAARKGRRQSSIDSLTSNLNNLANLIFTKKEAARGRVSKEEQAALDREATRILQQLQGEQELRRQSAADTAAYSRQELAGEQALAQIEASGAQQRLTQEEQAAQAEHLQTLNNSARAALQAQVDDATWNRLQAQFTQDQDMLDAQWRQGVNKYGEMQSWTSPTTGKRYTWDSEQGYNLAKAQMESDNYVEAQRVIAALKGTDPATQTKIWNAYEQARNEVLGQFADPVTGMLRPDADPDSMSAKFMDAVGIQGLTEEEAAAALKLFEGWLPSVQEAVPPEPAPPSATNITYPEGSLAADVNTHGFLGRAAAPVVGLASALLPGTAQRIKTGNTQPANTTESRAAGAAVDNIERPFYDQLMAMYSQSPRPEIKELMTKVENEVVPQDVLQQLMDELFSKLNPRQPRGFTYTPVR